MAAQLGDEPGVDIMNEVVLNQVLVRFVASGQNVTPAVVAAVQQEGVCWVGGTRWREQPAMRISVSNWRTPDDDVVRSARSIVGAFRACRNRAS